MNQLKSLVLLAGAALSLGGVNATLAADTTAAPAPAATSPDEVRAIVAEMLADAETRSSLLQSGTTAGHEKGKFFIGSADGNFRLNVGGMIQFRYILNFRDQDNTIGNDDFNPGFQARRTKLDFNGNIVSPDWTFRILGDFERFSGGSFILEDAWVGYNIGNGFSARFGQFKLPLLREELISDARQLAAERSLTNIAYTQGWSQGVELAYQDEAWGFRAAFSDGLNSQNTDFETVTTGAPTGFAVSGQSDWAVTGRFEYKFAGAWEQFSDFTSEQGSDFAALLGVAAHYQQSSNTDNITDTDRDTFQYTADLSFEGDGWNLFGAFIGRHEEFRFAGNNDDTDDFGGVVQGGFRVARDTEIFARWDAFFPDQDRTAAGGGDLKDTYNFITVGVNQYYAGHAAKATIDVVWAIDETSDLAATPFNFVPNTGTGILGNSEDNEVVVRFQFQLLF